MGLFCLAVGLFLYSIRAVLVRVSKGARSDFFHFYEGARAIRGGSDLYASGDGGYIYPPFFAFLLEPLAGLSLQQATVVWLAVNVTLILLVLLLGFRALARGFQLHCTRWQAIGVCSLAALMTSEQIRWELILGQSDTLILAGFVLGLFGLQHRPLGAGAALGAVANIKYQAVAVLPYLLLRGRWLAAAGLGIGFAACAIVPAAVVGWDRNLDYLRVAFGGMLELVGFESGRSAAVPELLWERSVTITSGLARICVAAGLPQSYAFPLAGLVAAAAGAAIWAMFRASGVPFMFRRPAALGSETSEVGIVCIEWTALLVGLLVFSPQGTKRHLFLLLLAHLLAAMLLWLPRPRVPRGPLIAGVLIAQLGLRLPSKDISETAAAAWHHIGGPGWCVLVFLLCTVWSALAYWRDVQRAE
jgi:hypothetical protein